MNNRALTLNQLAQPLMVDANFLVAHLQLINQFVKGQQISLPEKNIQLTYIQNGVFLSKDYNDGNPIENAFDNLAPDTTVVIPVVGAMTKYDVCGWYGMQSFAQLLRAAADNSNISNIVLKFDTGGGSSDGSLEFAHAVKYAASKKQTIAYIDGACLSAGYRVAAHASKIIAKPGSLVGSIGTLIELRFAENSNIKEIIITATKSTDKVKDVLEAKKGNIKLIQMNLLDPINERFINEIKEARNPDESVFSAAYFYSDKAIELGLIDEEAMFTDLIFSLENNTTMKLGDKIKQFLGIQEDTQLNDSHTSQLEQLAEKLTSQDATIQDLNQKVDSLKTENSTLNSCIAAANASLEVIPALQDEVEKFKEVKALFPSAENLVDAIKELQNKAKAADAQDGDYPTRGSKETVDGKKENATPTPEEKIMALPHNQNAIKSFFGQ